MEGGGFKVSVPIFKKLLCEYEKIETKVECLAVRPA
jgi:hypothetical protein